MAEANNRTEPAKRHKKQKRGRKVADVSVNPPSRLSLGSLFSCKHQHEPLRNRIKGRKMRCSGSLCSSKDNKSPVEPSKRRVVRLSSSSYNSRPAITGSAAVSSGGSFRGVHLRRFSGCYECQYVVDPLISRGSSLRASIYHCPRCGEVFMKPENLELHQAVRHAVLELGSEDTSRNIVEIIFQSSWLKKDSPVCMIHRILKVQNTQKTKSKFEDYRESIKSKANKIANSKKHQRCIADGNELLRFHCTTIKCSLGMNGSTNLCDSIPHCGVCSIIRDGFNVDALGQIRTMSTSGRADDAMEISLGDDMKAMLVCRVIAGRVRKNQDALEECDSVSSIGDTCSNPVELSVFNPSAILPCFVVIYGGF